jgi:hypothetical protein
VVSKLVVGRWKIHFSEVVVGGCKCRRTMCVISLAIHGNYQIFQVSDFWLPISALSVSRWRKIFSMGS